MHFVLLVFEYENVLKFILKSECIFQYLYKDKYANLMPIIVIIH